MNITDSQTWHNGSGNEWKGSHNTIKVSCNVGCQISLGHQPRCSALNDLGSPSQAMPFVYQQHIVQSCQFQCRLRVSCSTSCHHPVESRVSHLCASSGNPCRCPNDGLHPLIPGLDARVAHHVLPGGHSLHSLQHAIHPQIR